MIPFILATMGGFFIGNSISTIKYNNGGISDEYDHYNDFEFDTEGHLSAKVNGKTYRIKYRDDYTQIYDLYEDGKKIKSSFSVRELMIF